MLEGWGEAGRQAGRHMVEASQGGGGWKSCQETGSERQEEARKGEFQGKKTWPNERAECSTRAK